MKSCCRPAASPIEVLLCTGQTAGYSAKENKYGTPRGSALQPESLRPSGTARKCFSDGAPNWGRKKASRRKREAQFTVLKQQNGEKRDNDCGNDHLTP